MPALPQRSESGATKRGSYWPMVSTQAKYRKAAKTMRSGLAANTFEVIAREWHAKVASNYAETTHKSGHNSLIARNVKEFQKVMALEKFWHWSACAK